MFFGVKDYKGQCVVVDETKPTAVPPYTVKVPWPNFTKLCDKRCVRMSGQLQAHPPAWALREWR